MKHLIGKGQFLCLLFVVFGIACNTSNNTSESDKSTSTGPDLEKKEELLEDSSKIVYSVNKKTGKKYGMHELFDASNNLIERCSYRNDTLDGDKQFFYTDGKVEEILVYKDGLLQGEAKKYYATGVLKKEYNYTDNKLTGEMRLYYPDGSIKEKVTFENNLENGPFEEYAEGGKLLVKGTYISLSSEKTELEQGVLEKYNVEKGTVAERFYCIEGICCKVWTEKDGEVTSKSDLCPDILDEYKKTM
jgi:antitoxin component YwqK of YwqJK toxin-antitoxin module